MDTLYISTGTLIIAGILGGFLAQVILFLGKYIYNFYRNKATSPMSTDTDEFRETQVIIQQIRDIVLYQILNKHTKLFDAIAKQKKILNLQERKCIAIFISKDMFMELISNAAVYDHTQLDSLYPIMRDLGTPVGFLGNLPIYLSDLLDEAPVFVVGAISWSFEK